MDLINPEDNIKELLERKSDLKRWVEHLTRGENWNKVLEACQELIIIEAELKVWKTIKGV